MLGGRSLALPDRGSTVGSGRDDDRRYVSGDGPEAGSGGLGADVRESPAAWVREWRRRAATDPAEVEGAAPVAIRESRDGTVTAYRPAQLIVARRDLERVVEALARFDARVTDQRGEGEDGTVLLTVSDRVDVLSLTDRLRKSMDPADPPDVGPNHVFATQPYYQYGPGGVPEPDGGKVQVPEVAACRGEDDAVTIGVLDTGMWKGWPTHHEALKGRVELIDATESTATDFDPLVTGGPLVRDAGHGTFIAGIIAQRAPAARVDAESTLDALGLVDEYQVGLDLPDVAEAQILSLSFSGYTHRNRPPVEFSRLLDALPPDVEVVACAGNQGSTRPAWPAAFARVTAVAAVGRDHVAPGFTNRGWWVDACTYGVMERSTYVTGEYPRADGTVATFDEPVARWSGTSFAAPRYAAAVAAAMSEHGFGNARAASGHLLATGKPLGNGLGVFVP